MLHGLRGVIPGPEGGDARSSVNSREVQVHIPHGLTAKALALVAGDVPDRAARAVDLRHVVATARVNVGRA